MFSIRVERVISAAHGITIGGVNEPLHGHDWRVRVTIESGTLDDDGMVCDFHALEKSLDGILSPLQNSNLNETPPFDELNPTAENVAFHIARSMQPELPATVTSITASVTEAPGCEARCRLERS